MVNYLVAIDESENARAAFFTALSLIKNKQEDQLFLLGVVDDMKVYAWHSHGGMNCAASDRDAHNLLQFLLPCMWKLRTPKSTTVCCCCSDMPA